jgi:hypothetical protein
VTQIGTVADAIRHRLDLEPDTTSPRRARRFVAGLLAARRPEVVDVALLLVTELVTNAVVHAGTLLSVVVDVSADEVTVRVHDGNPGVVGFDDPAMDDLGEGGRGLALVNRLADVWGTEHARTGKEVWFRLASSHAEPVGGAHAVAPGIPTAPAARAPESAVRPAPRAPALIGDDLVERLTVSEELHELLERVVDVCRGSARLVADGAEIAAVGAGVALPGYVASIRIGGEQLGRLELESAPVSPEERSFVAIVASRIAVVLKTQRLHDLQSQERGASAFLAEASELLAGTLDASQTLAMLNHLVINRLADWSGAFRAEGDVLEPVAVAHVDESASASLADSCAPGRPLSQALAGALRHRMPDRATVDGDTVLLLPLVARGRSVGGLAVGRRTPFTPAEAMLIEDVARRGALAYDNALLYGAQVAVAKALQSTLLPPALPLDPLLDVAARYHAGSAGMDVGGDFYDIVRLPDGSWFLAIGDVCGKGAEAAAVTRVSRDVLRLLIRRGVPVIEALAELNRTLLEQGPSPRFCTLACAHLVPDGGGAFRAHVYSAGHPAPVVVRPDCATESSATGTLLGVFDDDALEFTVDTVTLSPGDALVFYTDGVTESRAGDAQFGDVRLLACLREPAVSASDVAGRLQQASTQFAGEALRDDVAVLVAMVPQGS